MKDGLAVNILNQEIYKSQTGLIPAVCKFLGTTFYTNRPRCYKW